MRPEAHPTATALDRRSGQPGPDAATAGGGVDHQFGDRIGAIQTGHQVQIPQHGMLVLRIGDEKVSGSPVRQFTQDLFTDGGRAVNQFGTGNEIADGILFGGREVGTPAHRRHEPGSDADIAPTSASESVSPGST